MKTSDPTSNQAGTSKKEVYTTPHLTVHGDLRKLTLGLAHSAKEPGGSNHTRV